MTHDESIAKFVAAREHARSRTAGRPSNAEMNAASTRALEDAMNKRSLRPFIFNWNREHADIQFCIGAEVPAGPASILVRFNADKYLQNHTLRDRSALYQQLGISSGHTLILANDNLALLQSGIIDIDVACLKPGFSIQKVIDGLRWLGEVFLMGDAE